MALDLNNINELRESFDHLVQKNYEIQDDIRMALSAEDYWKAVKSIDNFIKIIEKFLNTALDMAKKYNKIANYENKDICLKAEKMAKKIKAAHLEAEKNIFKKIYTIIALALSNMV
jgi:hypothetical protein